MEKVQKPDALDMVERNPFYLKYLKKKNKFISGILNRIDRKYQRRKKGFSREYFLSIIDDKDEYFFLSYMTRKYFLDNIIVNLIRICLCIIAIIAGFFMESHIKTNFMKGPMMVLLLSFGFFHGPLSFLYVLANFYCFMNYSKFVSDTESVLAEKINIFYDEDTDKFAGQNYFKQVKLYRRAHEEKKRKRGW